MKAKMPAKCEDLLPIIEGKYSENKVLLFVLANGDL